MKECPVCGGMRRVPLFTSANRHGRHMLKPDASFSIAACEGCGLMGPADVVADSTYYSTFYLEGYHGEDQAGGLIGRAWGWVAERLTRQKIKTISRFSMRKTARIRLLDVGCGPGYFLSQLDRTVFEPHGLEPVVEAVEAAQRRGLDVSRGDILMTPLGKAKYDVVTLWHVLEHIDHPDVALNRIHASLDEQGIVVIAMPNTRSLACKAGREYWFHLDSPRHLHLFNESNGCQLLEKCGFEVLHRAYLPFDFPLDLFWSLRRNWLCWPWLAVYPLAKLFDKENVLVIARKCSV